MKIYLIAWIPMAFIAIANGFVRDKGYRELVGELRAHQISTLSGVIFFFGYTWLLSLRWPFGSQGQALAVGAYWCCLTVAFEIIFGRFVVKNSWQKIAADYNLLKGRLWGLLMVWLFALPEIVYKIRS